MNKTDESRNTCDIRCRCPCKNSLLFHLGMESVYQVSRNKFVMFGENMEDISSGVYVLHLVISRSCHSEKGKQITKCKMDVRDLHSHCICSWHPTLFVSTPSLVIFAPPRICGFIFMLRAVPTIVVARTFCASRDTRISCGWCLLI